MNLKSLKLRVRDHAAARVATPMSDKVKQIGLIIDNIQNDQIHRIREITKRLINGRI
jgi:hypothetical protein